jgi:hypothetical protein
MTYEVVEDVSIDDLVSNLERENKAVCYQAAFVINALRGKKAVVAAPERPAVPGELVADPSVDAAPVTTAEAVASQDP